MIFLFLVFNWGAVNGFTRRLGQSPIISLQVLVLIAKIINCRPVLDVSLTIFHQLFSHAMWDKTIGILDRLYEPKLHLGQGQP